MNSNANAPSQPDLVKPMHSANVASNTVRQYFYTLPIAPDGNCLFASLCALFPGQVTVEQLRHIVARRFLNPSDLFASKTILNWAELYRHLGHEYMSNDVQCPNKKDRNLSNLMETVQHMKQFPHLTQLNVNMKDQDTAYLITKDQREFVYSVVMSQEFWGEEFSLQTLSDVLKLQFLIVDGSTIKNIDQTDSLTNLNNSNSLPKKSELEVYHILQPFLLQSVQVLNISDRRPIWLYLRSKHYQPLIFKH